MLNISTVNYKSSKVKSSLSMKEWISLQIVLRLPSQPIEAVCWLEIFTKLLTGFWSVPLRVTLRPIHSL